MMNTRWGRAAWTLLALSWAVLAVYVLADWIGWVNEAPAGWLAWEPPLFWGLNVAATVCGARACWLLRKGDRP